MLDFARYFDKKPTSSYAVGPSGLGVMQTGFGILWRGWHTEDGIFVEKFSEYNPNRIQGQYISGSDEILTTESLSFAWDANSHVWAGTHLGNMATVYAFSGVAHTAYTFTGVYPQVFFNSCYVSGQDRRIECYYLKPGQDSIFVRFADEDMATEHVFHSDLFLSPARLNQVINADFDNSRMEVFGRYSNGDFFKLTSEIYKGATDHCSNFENIPSGLVGRYVNNNVKSMYLLYRDVFWSQDLKAFSSGSYGGPTINKLPIMVHDDMKLYVSGQISTLNSGYGFYQGMFVDKSSV